LPVLLVVGKARAEDDGGVGHVQQFLQIHKHSELTNKETTSTR
jgi:hypothetical protein